MNDWVQSSVEALQELGIILVEDGNHGEYRPRPSEFAQSGTAFIRAADMDAGRVLFDSIAKINDTAFRRIRKGIGQPNDVLLSHKGTVGKVAWVGPNPPPFVCSPQTTFYRSLDPCQLDPRYLFFYLQSPGFQKQLRSRQGETDMAPYVSLTEQRRLLLTLPPPRQQRAIAEVLGALDDKIEVNERIRNVTDQCLSALFQQLAAPALMNLAEDEPLPCGWYRDRLESVLDMIETGSRPKGGVSAYSVGIPSLGAESVLGLARFDFSKTKYVPIEFFMGMKKGLVNDRDVLLYKDGGRPGEFEPHVSLLGMGFPFTEFCINEHVYRLRAAAPLTQEFLYYWLSSKPILEEMRRRGTGVAIPGLNSTAVKNLPIDVPPAEVIARFSSVADPMVSLALTSARESRLLAQLRDALLPKLLSGELRIRDAEHLVEEAV